MSEADRGDEAGATSAPLDDVLVVEIGERIGAGACGTLLAQLGATVIVLEPRQARAAGKWRNRAAYVAGKRSVIVDTGTGTGRHPTATPLRDALLESADVVLLSTDDGATLDAWRRTFAPATIVADITAFGHDGPWEGRGGSEEAVQALMGIVATTGPLDAPPVAVGVPVLETKSAVYAAASVLLALRVRRLHGIGQRIDIALADVAINSLANFLALHFGGLPALRSGNRHPLYVPWGSYRARDGYLLACSVTDEQFQRVCTAIGAPDLAADARYAGTTGRLRHFVEIDRRISAWAAERTVAGCEAALMEAGVASGRIVAVPDLADEPNLAHRASLLQLGDPESGALVTVPASPIHGTPIGIVDPVRIPRRGEDADAVRALLRERAARRTCAVGSGPERRFDACSDSDASPLAGVRVVEIGHYTVAPLASRILGAFGADVIKIEAPQGDAVRHGPPLRDDGQAYIFALSNTDKRGLVLNLRDDAEREQLHRLLAQADILVENMRPGTLGRLGFQTAVLRRRHPRLVCCSITGFGSDSVYEGRPALDTVIQAMSGMMSMTLANGEPTKTGISTSDNLGGLFGMLACIAGLEHRDRTGHAAHFDISMQDGSAWMTQNNWPAHPAPARILRACDGFVLVQGDPAASAEAAQRAMPRRTAVADAAMLSGESVADRATLAAALCAAGFEAVPVLDVAEVLAHPHTVARELLVTRPTSDGGAWTVLNSPMRLEATPPQVRSVMPRLGAENAAVIAELGLAAPVTDAV